MNIQDLPDMWTQAQQRYPAHAARIARGRALLEQHLQQPRRRLITARLCVNQLSFTVQSQSNPRGRYTVDQQGCTCPDWPTTHRCKHFVAVSTLCALIRVRLNDA